MLVGPMQLVELVLNCSLLNCYVGCVDWSVLQSQHSPADTEEGKCFLSSCLYYYFACKRSPR